MVLPGGEQGWEGAEWAADGLLGRSLQRGLWGRSKEPSAMGTEGAPELLGAGVKTRLLKDICVVIGGVINSD